MTVSTTFGETSRAPVTEGTRIWRLQYGPCWCSAIPADTGSFDFVRMRTSPADLGGLQQNLLIVSERVIDGSARVFEQVHGDVPDPKIVVATGTCPMAGRFWDELPMGWVPVTDVLPIDIHVEQCVGGHPEALMAAVIAHVLPAAPSTVVVTGDDVVSLSG